MAKEIVVSEADKIAAIIDNGVVKEFFLSEGEQFVGDIILASVESIVPAIEAAFLNIGREKSGFIHVSDVPASKKQQSGIRQYLKPKQTLLVQVTREATGNKGACLTGFITLPGRFLVLTPFERRIGLSKRIFDPRERARLARIARVICGAGYGIVLRPEAVGQTEQALREDLKALLARWKQILAQSEKSEPATTLYCDQDILERTLRDGMNMDISRITVDSQATYERAQRFFSGWSDGNMRSKLRVYNGSVPLLYQFNLYQQMEQAIQTLVSLPSGGTLVIEATEALTVVDVNTSSMTSTDNQPETIMKTNREAAIEIARQLVLRDIGGVIVIDFIDMDNPRDQQIVWQALADALHNDKSQPQISYFSEFGLVEMTRRRQRQRLSDILTSTCPCCRGLGRVRNELYRMNLLTNDGSKARLPLAAEKPNSRNNNRSATVYQETYVEVRETAPSPPPKVASHSRREAPVPKEQSTPVEHDKSEDPRDLSFDESYFTAPLTDEFLEQFIEREDALLVSAAVVQELDDLVARIEKEGLDVVKGSYAEPSTASLEPDSRATTTDEDDLADYIETDEDDGTDSGDLGSDLAESLTVEEVESVDEGGDDNDTLDIAEVEAESTDEEGAEPAAKTAKGVASKAKPKMKKLIGKKRSIRSFRPKK